jgi:transcriptional regulator with XRE-family HTH domain
MAKGYASKFVQAVEAADETKLGVRFGRVCIKNEIPVKDVSELLKVSRVTIYNWFTGKTKVQGEFIDKIQKIIQKLEQDA